MKYKIALIKGDGIGPEIVGSAVRVLQKAGEKFGHSFAFQEYLMGGCAIDASGTPLRAAVQATVCFSAQSAARSGTKTRRRCARKKVFWGCAQRSAFTQTCAPQSFILRFRRSAHSARTSLPMGST